MIDTRVNKPNGDPDQCQCVMEHFSMVDGAISQCTARRDRKHSNMYCWGCENTHGEAALKRKR